MKKIFLLSVLIILLTSCADTLETKFSETTAENVATIETESSAARTRLALDCLDLNVKGYRCPDNYAGAYVDGETLIIMLTDDDSSPYGYMSEYEDCIMYKLTEHSLNELEELFDSDILPNLLDEHDIEMVMMGIDQKSNAVMIEVFDKYTDEQKEKIRSYFEEYPVIIKFVGSRITPL